MASQSNLQQLAAAITGPGVTVSNPEVGCHSLGYGQYSYSGPGPELTSGVLLTSGRITDAPGPNNNSGSTNWFAQNTTGDPQLNAATGRNTRDACAFEFDLVPTGDSLFFSFVFASEEYNEWVGSNHNDVFGFFIQGPGINGDPGLGSHHNIALVPGSTLPVAINSINNGENSDYYVDNTGGQALQYDGHTTALSAGVSLVPCETYHLKLVIADATDRKYDSGVFIERIESPTVSVSALSLSGGSDMVEGCDPGWIRFDRGTASPDPLTLEYFLQGTATNGTDYAAIGNVNPAVAKTITIPANQSFVDQAVNPLVDLAQEGTELIRCVLGNPNCTSAPIDTLILHISDSLTATCSPGGTICAGGSWPLLLTGGSSYSWAPATGLSCATCPNPVASPSVTTTYTVTVSEGLCTRIISRQVRVSNLSLSTLITAPLCHGSTNGAINLTVSNGLAPYSISWTGPNGFTAGTEDITNLAAGTYTATVIDAGCTRTQSWNVIEPPTLTVSLNPAMLAFGQNIACHGGGTGSITSTISGGTAPYTISWTGPNGFVSSSANISALVAGTYTLNITDVHGCSANASTTLTESPAISFSANTTANVLCFGANTGAASTSVSGGIPPYSYAWNSTPVQTTANASGLTPGTYAVTLTDSYSCAATANVTISGPGAALSTNLIAQTNVLCFGNSSGGAGISISGGTAPYTTAWNTVPVQNGTNAANLPAGTWTATVTDANSCQATRTVTITQPASTISAALFAQTNVSCLGNGTGSATVSASGGTGPYTYLWNTVPVQNTATANNLIAGNYTCTVRDVNLCSATVNVTITQPAAALGTSIGSQTNVLCVGNSTGDASINVSGGTAPYGYSWNTTPAQSTANATGLPAGMWTCTVTDANGCSTTRSVTITQPAAASTGSITAQANVLCFGNSTGSATVSMNGGTAPYGYSWNTAPVQNTATASNLFAGSYTCTITDANGCWTTRNVTITQPAATLSASIASQTNVLCFGNNTGTAAVNVSGGTSPYAYSWNTTPVQTGSSASGLTAGSYTCTITDANGCSTSASVTITQPAAALSTSITAQTNVLIFGQSTGSATVTASDGTAPYAYAWSDGQAMATASALAAGTYNVTVTDANGCAVTTGVTITQPGSTLGASLISQANVDCFGNSTGSATMSANGGVPPYSFSWNTSPIQNDATASNLPAGSYTCTVSDINGASTTVDVLITQPATALSAAVASLTDVDCFGNSTGNAIVDVNGGTPSYAMVWNTSPAQSGASASNVAAGSYSCTIIDANGCGTSQTVTIGEPAAALTASISAQTNVDCFGNSTGSATASTSGGTAPYTFSWNTATPQGAATATDLEAGTWTCTITDAHGCTTSISAAITQPAAALSTGITGLTQATCGANNGGASTIVSGGTGPYGYSWNTSPVQTSASLSGVGAGTYTVTVSDAQGCSTSASMTITSPSGLAIAVVNTTSQTCFGTANGQVTVAASGGSAPYTIIWNTAPAQAGATASGLVAGSYTATVTDADGCNTSVSVPIDGPASPLALSLDNTTDVLCFNGTTGAATVSASGGLAPYTVSWNTLPTQNGATITDVGAGTYTASATDAFGCSSSIAAIIHQPLAPVDGYVDASQDVSCFGGNDGYATIEVTGGSGSYTIEWNTTPVQSGATATGLTAGTWFVTILDNNGCPTPKLLPVTITEPIAALALSETTSNYNGFGISCLNATDGNISVTTTGGTTAYTYAWSGPNGFISSTEEISGLAAGNYDLLVTDANGCTSNLSATLGAPTAIDATANITTATCGGASNGAIELNVSGGVPPYTFIWTGPDAFSAASEDISGLLAGVYQVTITGANGCTRNFSFGVNEPGLFNVTAALSDLNGSNVSCAASNDGVIDVTVTGGTLPYNYQWTGPGGFTANAEDISFLAAGTYDLTVVDANGCSVLAEYTLVAPATLFTTLVPQTYPSGGHVSCHGASDGGIDASINGGTPGYGISWSGPNGFTSNIEDINTLAPGTYTVTISDANGCNASQSVTLDPPSQLNTSVGVSQYNSGDAVSCNGASTGIIDLAISGGLAPYSVNWSGPSGYTSTDIDISGLAAGTYTAVVNDAAGCDTTFTVTLTEPPPVVASGSTSDLNGFAIGCSGSSDGSVDLTVGGGAGNFTFLWTGPNAFISNSEDVSGLGAGSYDVIVNDMNGCKAYLTFTLDAPPLISATSAITTAACQGADNGAIDLTIGGGVAPYGAQWNGPGGFNAITEDLSTLFAGIYDVTITDANGCTFNQSFDVNEPGLFTITATSTVYPGGYGVSCNAASDGSLDVNASGGTSPLFFAWQGPTGFSAITEDINGLAAGMYGLTLTDANGCSHLASWMITSPTPINIGLSPSQFPDGSNVACSNGGDGSIDATIIGGVAPYSISWNGPNGPMGVSEDLTGLASGTYTVSVVDAIGCSANASITLTEPTPISLGTSASFFTSGGNVSCNGSNDGSIDLSISGGSLLYFIHWTGPNGYASNNEDISGLEAGTYNATVMDANGCSTSTSITLIATDPILIDLSAALYSGGYSIGCNGTTGDVHSIVQGGAVPWTYLWSGPNGFTSNAQDLNDVPAGIYDLLVTTVAGCTATASVTLLEPAPIDMTATVSAAGNGYEVSCYGNDGSIDLSVNGGTGPYIIDWSGTGGFASLNEDLSGLAAGIYDVTITDVNGCASQMSFALDQAAALTATTAITGNVCDGLDDGAVDLIVSGGVAPYASTWNGPNGFTSTDEDINGLAGGTYTVDITDANGCTAQQSATIAASSPIDLSVYVSDYGDVNIPCSGASTGVIEASISGGAGSLDIVWSGPNGFTSNAPFLSGLAAGDYLLSITDDNGCSRDTSIALIEPDAPIVGSMTAALQPSGTNVSCSGGSDGSIDLTVSGGVAPYDITWHGPGGTSYPIEDPADLLAGHYDVVITDVNSCSLTDSINLTEPDSALLAAVSLSQYNGGFNTSCDGNSDGNISVSISGGSGAYELSWTGPGGFLSNADSIGGLQDGTYTLTVTDMNGCALTEVVNVVAPEPITWELIAASLPSGTNISCHGMNDGAISASVDGGSGTYEATWTGPDGYTSSSLDIADLYAGEYCILILDGNGCSASDCITLSEPAVLDVSALSTAAGCGQSNGSVDASASGGTTPYTYAWSNGAFTEDISGVPANNYWLIVTDANGCNDSTMAQVAGGAAIGGEATVSDVLCHSDPSGSIDLNMTSGSAPFTFAWTGGSHDEDLAGLQAGSYQVQVTDASGCGWTEVFTVHEPDALNAESTVLTHYNGSNVSAPGAHDGSIAVEVNGGNAPYTYLWSNGATGTVVEGLAVGTYAVTITDANGCTRVMEFTLSGPDGVELPTGFTPNGDGQNDLFVIHGLENHPENQLLVFNRWGNVVYDRLNYKNDWGGENREGEYLPNGTYFIILRLGSEATNQQGYVDLRR